MVGCGRERRDLGENRRRPILQKLGVESRTQAVSPRRKSLAANGGPARDPPNAVVTLRRR